MIKLTDKIKLDFIRAIDRYIIHFAGTVYEPDLQQMRSKWIYKDVNIRDLYYDKEYIKNLKEIKDLQMSKK